MSQYYLKQFIEEASRHVNPKIKTYYEIQKSILKTEYLSFTDVVEDAIDFYFEGKTARQDLTPLIVKIKAARKKKIKRLCDKTHKDFKVYPIDNSKNPFYNTYMYASTLPFDKYYDLYENKTVEQIIAQEVQNFDNWYSSKKLLLIECPRGAGKTSASVFKNIKNDIIMDVIDYVENDLDCNINSFVRKYPAELIEKPLFSPTPFLLISKKATSSVFKEIIKDENDNPLLTLDIDNSSKENNLPSLKALSSYDLELINVLISNIEMSDFIKYKSVTMDLNAIARSIVNYTPGKNALNKVELACKRLVDYNFSYEADNATLHFNLFDNILIKHDAQRPYAIATFGEVLFNAIVQRKIISVTSADYVQLNNNLSKIICYALKQEQIIHQDQMCDDYGYSYFQRIVRFKLKNKTKNIKLIKESLDEFVANKIVIDSYELKKDIFTIKFMPLSQAEKDDIDR